MSEVSNEYAKALFMLAGEKECIDEFKNALETVSDVFNTTPEYVDFLSTFAIPLEERLNALEVAFSKSLPRDVISFLKILCEKKHIAEFFEIADYYNILCNEIGNVCDAKVTSAVELTDNEKTLIKEKLEKSIGKAVQIEYVIDKSIIGGLIVDADGKIIDSSIKKHLKSMKDVINK